MASEVIARVWRGCSKVLTQERSSLEVFLFPAVALQLRLPVVKLTATRLSSPSEEPSLQRELRHLLTGCLKLILLHSLESYI